MEFTYRKFAARKIAFLAAGVLLCLLAFLGDILIGCSGMHPAEVFSILTNPGGAPLAKRAIVWSIRLPTALMALAVGASLGVSGAAMQTILGNPLASPYTLGLSAGAGFGASFALVVGLGAIPLLGGMAVPACAFCCALLACMGIYAIARKKDFSSGAMVLAGIGMVFFFNAGQSFMQYVAPNEALASIVFWTFGSLNKADWPQTLTVIGMFVLVFCLIYKNAWKLTALTMGDERARVLGVDVKRLRLLMFVVISLLTATAVSFVGCIGFVGIVGPHIARIVLGEDQRFYLPMSAVTGALILSVASIATKSIFPGAVFPIGILTSLIGVPVFFALVMKKR